MSRGELAAAPTRAVEAVARWGLTAAGVCYIAIAALILFDILARRLLGFSSAATTELTGYLLATGTTFGMAGTLFGRAHVRIDVLVRKLPLRWRVGLHFVALTALLVTNGFLTWGALQLALESWELRATDVSGLRTPLVLPQGAWTLGLLLMLLAVVALMCRCLAWLFRGQLEAIDRALLSRTDEEDARDTVKAAGLAGAEPKFTQ